MQVQNYFKLKIKIFLQRKNYATNMQTLKALNKLQKDTQSAYKILHVNF